MKDVLGMCEYTGMRLHTCRSAPCVLFETMVRIHKEFLRQIRSWWKNKMDQ